MASKREGTVSGILNERLGSSPRSYTTRGENLAIRYNPDIDKHPERAPSFVPPSIMGGEYTEGFNCPRGEQVAAIAYDRKRMLMLVTWVRGRSGKKNGVPPGNKTVYNNVAGYTFDYLRETAENGGRCGHELHMLIKGAVSDMSLAPYTNIGGEA